MLFPAYRRCFIAASLLGSLALVATGCSKARDAWSGTTAGGPVIAAQNDGDVATQVRSALLRDAVVGSLGISVTSLNGDLRLTGFVGSQAQSNRAEAVAHEVAGVHAIHNELAVR
jgi:hyperosmotically inducible protein